MPVLAMSTPAEPFFLKPSDILTNKGNKLYPATTKMLVVVTDMVRIIRPGDVKVGVESDDVKLEDDADLKRQILRETKDTSDDEIELDFGDLIEIN